MTQKLIIMERDTKDELQEAIVNNLIEGDNGLRISAISVLENWKLNYDYGKTNISFEAWIVVEVPDNKNRFYDEVMGMTE